MDKGDFGKVWVPNILKILTLLGAVYVYFQFEHTYKTLSNIKLRNDIKLSLFREVKDAIGNDAVMTATYVIVDELLKEDTVFRNTLIGVLKEWENLSDFEKRENLPIADKKELPVLEHPIPLKFQKHYTIDVFHLEGIDESEPLVESVCALLRSEYPNFTIRKRILYKSVNARSGYRIVRNEIRFERDEKLVAEDISNFLNGNNIFPVKKEIQYRTKDLISIFIVDAKRNGDAWSPDNIELVYVEGAGSGPFPVKGFHIGKYEVTQAQWKEIMNNNPSMSHKGDNLPVEHVNWDDVQVFLSKLNTKTGRNYRLPTEVEWEFAARGGTVSKGYNYSGSNNIDDVAWYKVNSSRTNIVGLKQPNELGIYDMSGNVYEWCSDFRTNGSSRVVRGGSFANTEEYCRVTKSNAFNTGTSEYNIGFRVVLP